MKLLRVDEGPIHVPEYCSTTAHELSCGVFGADRPDNPHPLGEAKHAFIRSSRNLFSYLGKRELLQVMGIAVELANALS